jgi:hypothetical protein
VAALADEFEADGAVEGEGVVVGLGDEGAFAGATEGVLEAGAAVALAAVVGGDGEEDDLAGQADRPQPVEGDELALDEATEELGVGVVAGGRQGGRGGRDRAGAGRRRQDGGRGGVLLRKERGDRGVDGWRVGRRRGGGGGGLVGHHDGENVRRSAKGLGSP